MSMQAMNLLNELSMPAAIFRGHNYEGDSLTLLVFSLPDTHRYEETKFLVRFQHDTAGRWELVLESNILDTIAQIFQYQIESCEGEHVFTRFLPAEHVELQEWANSEELEPNIILPHPKGRIFVFRAYGYTSCWRDDYCFVREGAEPGELLFEGMSSEEVVRALADEFAKDEDGEPAPV